ncbi:hypothetical protein [Streptomyces murinus]|uniref:hypothetical protein n=1 Tax=Streptomyces murinus TaxID=33900 RepID=UPI0036E6FD5C
MICSSRVCTPAIGAARGATCTLDHPGDAHDWPSRMHLEMALQFDTWLSHYGIERAI